MNYLGGKKKYKQSGIFKGLPLKCFSFHVCQCMKSGHPAWFILMFEVYLQFIYLRQHCASELFPFTPLAIIIHDRIKLY